MVHNVQAMHLLCFFFSRIRTSLLNVIYNTYAFFSLPPPQKKKKKKRPHISREHRQRKDITSAAFWQQGAYHTLARPLHQSAAGHYVWLLSQHTGRHGVLCDASAAVTVE
jgi:hypothetical protein